MKKRTLNELRQTKEYYKPKTVEEKCEDQTDKVNKKITELVNKAHKKLNSGTGSEKMMAVGIIQLVNEITGLCKECPNYSDLGKNINKIFGIDNKL